jgi:hypothetical protein
MHRALVVALIFTACGNDTHHMTTVTVDAPGMGSGSAHIDAPPQQGGPNVVTLQLFSDPDLIVYRDGSGPWMVPTASGQGIYDLHVTDAYQVVVACSSTGVAGNEDSEQLNATFGDGAHQYMFCDASSSSTAPTTFAVTGQMAQAGTVIVGGVSQKSNTAAWSFSLAVPMGTHDEIAFDGLKMQITRDIAVNAAVALPNIDVATNGTTYTKPTLALTGLGTGDTTQTQSILYTNNDYVQLSQTTNATAVLAPDSLLGQNDFTELDVNVTNMTAGTFRGASTYDNTTTAFTLPAVLTGVTFGTAAPITAQWGTLPAASNAYLSAESFTSTTFTAQRVSATQSWISETNATSLAFASDAPSYDPAWNVDPTTGYLSFEISLDSQTGSLFSGVESSPQTAQLMTGAHSRVQQAARRARLVASGNKHVRSL